MSEKSWSECSDCLKKDLKVKDQEERIAELIKYIQNTHEKERPPKDQVENSKISV